MVYLGIVAAAAPAPATAQCVFDLPNGSSSYVGSITTSLVRAFVSCNNVGGNAAGSQSQAGVPTCQPVETIDQHNGTAGWRFGPGTSYGRLSITRASANYPDFPLTLRDAAVKLKLYHIDSTDGGSASGNGSLWLILRATFDDPIGGDMTAFDFPYYFNFTLSGSGSVSLTKKLGEVLAELDQPPFPDCTSIELVSAFIRDPNGNTFAVPGMKIK
jgi:hypothetical protein